MSGVPEKGERGDTPAPVVNERQRFWLDSATTEAERGNDVAATLFWLIGQPSERERRERERGQA